MAKISLNLTREEEKQLVAAAAAQFPAAQMLQNVHLDQGKISVKVDSPVGTVRVDLELVVTEQG